MSRNLNALKKQAANKAAEFVESGMVVGLGHGSTALFAVQRIAERIKNGEVKNILAIPCSLFIEAEARRLGIPLTTLEENPKIDLTIDGADEISQALDLIKGGGGALLREKIVAQASAREIIIVDETKLSEHLGEKWAVPVEVIPFGWKTEQVFLASLGADVKIRKAGDGADFRTEQGNMILDANFGPVAAPEKLAEKLNARAAIVEHGLFIGVATEVIVAGENGVRVLKRNDR
ncbi:MAG: ribose-5-phosphate isomerase RpiA [bacterium]